jgi:hypothetical protein
VFDLHPQALLPTLIVCDYEAQIILKRKQFWCIKRHDKHIRTGNEDSSPKYFTPVFAAVPRSLVTGVNRKLYTDWF